MPTPLFIATLRFDSSDGERWNEYIRWAKIPALVEVVSLDMMLCPRVVLSIEEEDWQHIVREDFRLKYFYHLDYLQKRAEGTQRKNILGLYRNPDTHITSAPAPGDFGFVGYDLIEEETQISVLTNCGGFPGVFKNEELNQFGLLQSFDRAAEVQCLLADRYPGEPHAQCEMYALWRMGEGGHGSARHASLDSSPTTMPIPSGLFGVQSLTNS